MRLLLENMLLLELCIYINLSIGATFSIFLTTGVESTTWSALLHLNKPASTQTTHISARARMNLQLWTEHADGSSPSYTFSRISWQCVVCRHEITPHKFSKGRMIAQTSEGSRVAPELILYMCCICLPLKRPERSICFSRYSTLRLCLQTTSRLTRPPLCLCGFFFFF